MSMRPTDVPEEMIEAFANDAEWDEHSVPAIASGLARVLEIVEREHKIEVSKLRGALTMAGNSRELWKGRAIAAGWRKR